MNPRKFSVEERFLAKVRKQEDGCWIWTACVNWKGYGVVTVGGQYWTAHRFAWFLTHGPIPRGMCIRHTCHVRQCVNVQHLCLGSAWDNIQDRVRAGRGRYDHPQIVFYPPLPKKTFQQRFDDMIDKSGTPDGCWLWTGAIGKTGYGYFHSDRAMEYAHRVAWRFSNGEIPKGMKVLHRCDVRSCVRIDHLFLGTSADNTRDCIAKGRFAVGEKQWASKVSAVQVLEMRRLYQPFKLGYKKLGIMFGITASTVHKIVSGQRWKHI